MLTLDQILAVRPQVKEIHVPEWGGSIWVRPLTEIERGKFSDLATRYENAHPSDRIRLVTFPIMLWAVCKEDGSPLFPDLNKVAEVAANSPSSAFLRLQEAIFEISAFTKDAREALEKNSQTIPSAESSSV